MRRLTSSDMMGSRVASVGCEDEVPRPQLWNDFWHTDASFPGEGTFLSVKSVRDALRVAYQDWLAHGGVMTVKNDKYARVVQLMLSANLVSSVIALFRLAAPHQRLLRTMVDTAMLNDSAASQAAATEEMWHNTVAPAIMDLWQRMDKVEGFAKDGSVGQELGQLVHLLLASAFCGASETVFAAAAEKAAKAAGFVSSAAEKGARGVKRVISAAKNVAERTKEGVRFLGDTLGWLTDRALRGVRAASGQAVPAATRTLQRPGRRPAQSPRLQLEEERSERPILPSASDAINWVLSRGARAATAARGQLVPAATENPVSLGDRFEDSLVKALKGSEEAMDLDLEISLAFSFVTAVRALGVIAVVFQTYGNQGIDILDPDAEKLDTDYRDAFQELQDPSKLFVTIHALQVTRNVLANLAVRLAHDETVLFTQYLQDEKTCEMKSVLAGAVAVTPPPAPRVCSVALKQWWQHFSGLQTARESMNLIAGSRFFLNPRLSSVIAQRESTLMTPDPGNVALLPGSLSYRVLFSCGFGLGSWVLGTGTTAIFQSLVSALSQTGAGIVPSTPLEWAEYLLSPSPLKLVPVGNALRNIHQLTKKYILNGILVAAREEKGVQSSFPMM